MYQKMLKLVYVLFVILLVATVVLSDEKPKEKKCSPWLGYCTVYEHCCRYLECSSYLTKCAPKGGIIPGQDNRPIGPPPYAPHIKYLADEKKEFLQKRIKI